MADVKVGTFKPIGLDDGGYGFKWVAELSHTPNPGWRKAFHNELANLVAIGNPGVRNPSFEGSRVTFVAPENAAKAAADMIRDAVNKTNQEAAKQEADAKKQFETNKRNQEEAAQDLKRLQDKYRDGL
jgi:hypothetical protein